MSAVPLLSSPSHWIALPPTPQVPSTTLSYWRRSAMCRATLSGVTSNQAPQQLTYHARPNHFRVPAPNLSLLTYQLPLLSVCRGIFTEPPHLLQCLEKRSWLKMMHSKSALASSLRFENQNVPRVHDPKEKQDTQIYDAFCTTKKIMSFWRKSHFLMGRWKIRGDV